jgi:hypothetical protein
MAAQILAIARRKGLEPGARLVEQRLVVAAMGTPCTIAVSRY